MKCFRALRGCRHREKYLPRQSATPAQTTHLVDPLPPVGQHTGRIRLCQEQRFDDLQSLIAFFANKWEIHLEIIRTNFGSLESSAHVRPIEQLTHRAFKKTLLVLFGDEIALNIKIK